MGKQSLEKEFKKTNPAKLDHIQNRKIYKSKVRKAKKNRRQLTKENMRDIVSIGEKIICKLPMQHTHRRLKAGEKLRPVFVYGIHYGINGNIRALEVITATASNEKQFAIHYPITKTHNCFYNKNSYIIPSKVFIVPYTPAFFPKGAQKVAHLSNQEIPDIIARRAHGVINDHGQIYTEIFSPKESFSREGFILSNMKKNVVKSRRKALDIGDNITKSHIKHIQPDFLNAANVDQIALWASEYSKKCMSKAQKIIWPEPGTWPNWPDISDGNGNTIPCISPERKKELLAEPEIIAPVVTVNTKPTAAQTRLAGFKFL